MLSLHRVIEDVDEFPFHCHPCVHEDLLFIVSHGALRCSVPTVESNCLQLNGRVSVIVSIKPYITVSFCAIVHLAFASF